MSEFTLHTLDTAPQASRKLLQKAEKQFGFIPNLLAVMAESSVTLESYLTLTGLFDKTAFTVTERQLILLSISRFRNCSYCLAAHGTVVKMQKIPVEIIHAVYYNHSLQDSRLEALRTFTLDVVLGISFKTLSNYINHINDTPIDAQFLTGIPSNEPAATA